MQPRLLVGMVHVRHLEENNNAKITVVWTRAESVRDVGFPAFVGGGRECRRGDSCGCGGGGSHRDSTPRRERTFSHPYVYLGGEFETVGARQRRYYTESASRCRRSYRTADYRRARFTDVTESHRVSDADAGRLGASQQFNLPVWPESISVNDCAGDAQPGRGAPRF